MAKKPPQFLHTRTVALAGHRSSGKTSVAEACLLLGGAVRTLGSVQSRTSLLDADDESRRHGATMQPNVAWLPWNDHVIQLVDTPGSLELETARDAAIAGVDAVIVVVDAVSGVELGTRRVLQQCERLQLPVMVVVNKADRLHDVGEVLSALASEVSGVPVPLTLPVAAQTDAEPALAGVIDVIGQRVWRYLDDRSGSHSVEPLPHGMDIHTYRDRLTEAVALTDDELLDHYLEFLDLPNDRIRAGLANAVQWGGITPVVFVSATECVGVHHLLDTIAVAMPAPMATRVRLTRADGEVVDASAEGPFAAQVLCKSLDANGAVVTTCRVRSGVARRKGGWRVAGEKSPRRVNKLYHLRGSRRGLLQEPGPGGLFATWELDDIPVGATLSQRGDLSVGPSVRPCNSEGRLLRPATASDARRLPDALNRLCHGDSWLSVDEDPLTGRVVLRGPSQLALSLAVERLERLGVTVHSSEVPIAYREVPATVVREISGEHKKVDSDDDIVEYGLVTVDIVPTTPDTPLRLVFDCAEADLPSRFYAAIERGARTAMEVGPRAGYPLTGVQMIVTSGAYNAIFSTEEHLELAAERAVRAAVERAGTNLVEPWLQTTTTVPAATVGAALAVIGAHQGRVIGVTTGVEDTDVTALVPERLLRRMRSKLSSATGGTSSIQTQPDHYEVLSDADAARIAAGSPVSVKRVAAPSGGRRDSAPTAARARG